MIVKYSPEFVKSTKKLSGKILNSVKETIEDVKRAEKVEDISNCKKLTDYTSIYRIRIGSLRAFFKLYITIEGNIVKFEYLVPRGEAYKKDIQEKLRTKDK